MDRLTAIKIKFYRERMAGCMDAATRASNPKLRDKLLDNATHFEQLIKNLTH